MDLHYVLDRPHLNDGARVVRVKPRYNADVNQWWLCDEGRYGFGWIDHARLDKVRGPFSGAVALPPPEPPSAASRSRGEGVPPAQRGPPTRATWEQAPPAIATAPKGGAHRGV